MMFKPNISWNPKHSVCCISKGMLVAQVIQTSKHLDCESCPVNKSANCEGSRVTLLLNCPQFYDFHIDGHTPVLFTTGAQSG